MGRFGLVPSFLSRSLFPVVNSLSKIFRKGRLISLPAFLLLAITCALLFSACSTLTQVFEQARPSQDIHLFSDKAVILDLPFEFQKTPNLCGFASVEMLTRYYSVPLNDAERQSLSDEAAKNQGISGSVLKTVLEGAGYFVAVFSGTIDREPTGIYRHLDCHRPLIIMLGSVDGKSDHYVLLTGYDPERNLVALSDPARGQFAVPLENFKKSWIQANRFTLLAIPATLQKKRGEDKP
jgi:hypothetical protein